MASLNALEIRNTRDMVLPTRCEQDVLCLVAEGMRTQRTSAKLNLREHSARNYLFRVFDELGITSRGELVLYAVSGLEQTVAPPTQMTESGGITLQGQA